MIQLDSEGIEVLPVHRWHKNVGSDLTAVEATPGRAVEQPSSV